MCYRQCTQHYAVPSANAHSTMQHPPTMHTALCSTLRQCTQHTALCSTLRQCTQHYAAQHYAAPSANAHSTMQHSQHYAAQHYAAPSANAHSTITRPLPSAHGTMQQQQHPPPRGPPKVQTRSERRWKPLTRTYGWVPHNASFGFLDLTPSILLLRQFWD
jgi:hypothetical protein